jgi:ElaB/YqjD/DUF883 family membrane-anchored ribosome-binding protein
VEENPEAIKQEIEETRGRMGDTVEALAYKTDVKARARDAVADRVDAIRGQVGRVGDSVQQVGAQVRDQLPTADDARQGVEQLRSLASRNPLGIAIGAVAVGFLLGLVLPVTDIERERVGPIGEQMTDTAKEAASKAIEQGKAAVTQAIGDALGGSSGSGGSSASSASSGSGASSGSSGSSASSGSGASSRAGKS